MLSEQIKLHKLTSDTSYNQSFIKIILNNTFSFQELSGLIKRFTFQQIFKDM